METKLDKLTNWFNDFTASYLGESDYIDQNVALKHTHTFKVCEEMNFLTDKLSLSKDDSILAKTIALLHDVGRFEQVKKYGTFEDAKSVDHSKLGLEIIAKHNLLEEFSDAQQLIIKTAILNHNRKELQIPEELNDSCLVFAKLIRDADKIDIYRVVIDGYKLYLEDPKKFNLAIGFKDDNSGACSEKVVNALLNRDNVDYSDLKTLNDRKLLQLIWLYDINFTASLEIIIERGYVDFIFSQLPDNAQTAEIKTAINTYIKQKCSK